MSEIKQLPTRDEVPTPLTWDLTKILKMMLLLMLRIIS